MSIFFSACSFKSDTKKYTAKDLQKPESNIIQIDSIIIEEENVIVDEKVVESKVEAVEEKLIVESQVTINNSTSSENVKASRKKKSPPLISFEKNNFDFGRIVQGEKVMHEFVFFNKGEEPLIIINAEASCGCTKPVYPFVPIEAGEKGTILVQFNSAGRLGRQSSNINVISNASKKVMALHLSGEVVTPEFTIVQEDSTGRG